MRDTPVDLQGIAEWMLTLTPHVVADQRDDGLLLWADARGLPASRIARTILRAARRAKLSHATVGVSRVAIVAEIAAIATIAARTTAVASRDVPSADGTTNVGYSLRASLTQVAAHEERQFLAIHSLRLLAVHDAVTHALSTLHTRASASVSVRRTAALIAALTDVGIETCGDLARLTREAVEVRFGVEGVALWRLARAEDSRRIFRSAPRALPSASLEWFEFELRDPERLVFVVNRLAESVCTELQTRGETARAMTLTFALVGGEKIAAPVRCARPTADRATWLRLVRAVFERITLPDAVCGLTLSVEGTQENDTPQGDLFDAGFQTGAAGEAAVARLVDDETGAAVLLTTSSHALPEHRAHWRPLDTHEVAQTLRAPTTAPSRSAAQPQLGEPLALRLLATPRRVVVTTRERRGFAVPARYCEHTNDSARTRHAMPLVNVLTAAGPDSMSVGQESGTAVVREYWQCLKDDGQLVLLFRDAAAPATDAIHEGTANTTYNATTAATHTATPAAAHRAHGHRAESVWYLHGWWD